MRIYIFKSEIRNELRAFAGDPTGIKLPTQYGPWTIIGIVGAAKDPPYKLSRDAIEAAIDAQGFQLWRLGKRLRDAGESSTRPQSDSGERRKRIHGHG
jgi:hypothetical protein